MADAGPPLMLDAPTRRGVLAAAATGLLPLLLQLPQTIGITIAAAAVVVTALSWRKPLPAPLRLLLTLALLAIVLNLTGFSVGRDSGCALLAAMLAAKPSETFNLRDARSLLGFALFAPFATFLLDQGPVALALGLLAAIAVLLALLRLADLESGDIAYRPRIRDRLVAIGRLMAIGLPLALAAFWLFPRLGTPLWGVPERALSRPGLSDTMRPGEWVDLMSDDSPALRVQFFGETPPVQQMYWRGPVLWNFDGREWTQPGWFRALPAAPMEPGDVRWDYRIELEATDQRQLVALDLPLAAPEGARLSLDHGLHVRRPLTSLSRWRIQSAPPRRYEPELRRTLRSAALALPDGFNPRTVALARQWRREAGNDDVAIVTRAMDWIRSDFAYTLGTPLLGRHSVDEFLFDEQAGFCEHFSSSFVVLMRAAGIPARVVTGYTGGYYNRFGDYWIVRRLDAHAWAEVWLEGRGWVRADPTAAVAPERIYDTIEDRAGVGGGLFGDAGGLSPMLDMTDWLRRGWNDFVLGFDASRQRQLFRPLGLGDMDGARLAALFSLVAALALLWMAWLSRKGEREPDPVLRAWRALGQRYVRLGLEPMPHETARDWAARVGRAQPHLAAELNALSEDFSDWRYAAPTPGHDAVRDLVRRLRAHRPTGPRPARNPGERR